MSGVGGSCGAEPGERSPDVTFSSTEAAGLPDDESAPGLGPDEPGFGPDEEVGEVADFTAVFSP